MLGSSGGGEDMGKLIGLRQARLNTNRMVVVGILREPRYLIKRCEITGKAQICNNS